MYPNWKVKIMLMIFLIGGITVLVFSKMIYELVSYLDSKKQCYLGSKKPHFLKSKKPCDFKIFHNFDIFGVAPVTWTSDIFGNFKMKEQYIHCIYKILELMIEALGGYLLSKKQGCLVCKQGGLESCRFFINCLIFVKFYMLNFLFFNKFYMQKKCWLKREQFGIACGNQV